MSRPTALSPTQVAAIRTKTGAPVADDDAGLIDANYPVLASATLGGAYDCYGFETLWFGVELAGGSSPTCTVDLLFRDPGAADGSRWKRNAPTVGGSPITLAFGTSTNFAEITVNGWLIYPRLTVTGSPTSVIVLARPGAPGLHLQRSTAWA